MKKGRGRNSSKEKIFSVIISFAVIFTLGYGIYSVVNTAGKPQNSENNIVNLDETENENVAIRTEDADTPWEDTQDSDEGEGAEEANAGASSENAQSAGNNEEDVQEATEAVTEPISITEETPVVEEAAADPVSGYSFGEGSSLLWPVQGDIILKYSMDSTIYYETLGVYKCNPSVSIAAAVGQNVGVAADGIVESVEIDEETGNTVSVAIGDGYTATYGMLDNVVVKAGDTVTAGQLIGTVAEPTAYYAQEGANVYFKLTKDGEPVDPTPLFEE